MIEFFKAIAAGAVAAAIIMWVISFWVNGILEAQTNFFIKASMFCLGIFMIAMLALGVAHIAHDLGSQELWKGGEHEWLNR